MVRESSRQDGLLHTTCRTLSYCAPEVITKKGYDGTKVDVWCCGVILFGLLAGSLPFQDPNRIELNRKISRGEFKCPSWFPPKVRKLLVRILDPNPSTRITIAKIMENSWFRKGFKPPHEMQNTPQQEDTSCSSAEPADNKVQGANPVKPTRLNAFDF